MTPPEPTTTTQAAARAWIARALQVARPDLAEAEVKDVAIVFDEIALTWHVTTEQAVEWIHNEREPNAANFRAYCVDLQHQQQTRLFDAGSGGYPD